MRLNEHKILVLNLEDWQNAGLSVMQYQKARQRKQLETTCIGGNGRKVEIIFDSMAERFKEAIIAAFGNPLEHVVKWEFEQHLNSDYSALEFFASFEPSLPDNVQREYHKAAQYLNFILEASASKKGMSKIGATSKSEFYDSILAKIKAENVQLPTTYSKLRAKLRDYAAPVGQYQHNYSCLVNGKFGNNNTRKITGEASEWIIEQYARPFNKLYPEELFTLYNIEAIKRGWKPLESHRAISAFLNQPDVKPKWYAARHGVNKAKEKFGYTLRTELPSYRDALWYSDGTKLNFYYKPEKGSMKADLIVYEVMDAYSEVMLGHHIGDRENFIAMYHAFKTSLQFSHAKPFQIAFDNGGGHSRLDKEGFIDKMARVANNTQPYNGKSKTIESAFGRFQSHVMKRLWFFTGQNITAKSENSRSNMEFITRNATKLPSKEEAIAEYVRCRQEWNHAPHPKYGKPRIEVYMESVNPKTQPISYLDMIDIFWLETSKAIKYFNHGISLTLDGHKYEYEVLDAQGMPDMEFRSKHIDDKFTVKYDPADLSHIRLYHQTPHGLKFIATAQPRITVPRAIQDHKPGDRAMIDKLLEIRKQEVREFKKQAQKQQDKFEQEYFSRPVQNYDKQVSLADVTDNPEDFGLSIYDRM